MYESGKNVGKVICCWLWLLCVFHSYFCASFFPPLLLVNCTTKSIVCSIIIVHRFHFLHTYAASVATIDFYFLPLRCFFRPYELIALYSLSVWRSISYHSGPLTRGTCDVPPYAAGRYFGSICLYNAGKSVPWK